MHENTLQNSRHSSCKAPSSDESMTTVYKPSFGSDRYRDDGGVIEKQLKAMVKQKVIEYAVLLFSQTLPQTRYMSELFAFVTFLANGTTIELAMLPKTKRQRLT